MCKAVLLHKALRVVVLRRSDFKLGVEGPEGGEELVVLHGGVVLDHAHASRYPVCYAECRLYGRRHGRLVRSRTHGCVWAAGQGCRELWYSRYPVVLRQSLQNLLAKSHTTP